MSTCFLVLGQPRSGTSLAAGILHHLGIPMGQFIDDPVEPRWDFAGEDEWNPKGFFEDAAFVNWSFSVMGWPWPECSPVPSQQQLEMLLRLIEERSQPGVNWGVKSAGLAYCLGDFRRLCRDETIVIRTRRKAVRSVTSWAARAKCSPEEATQIVSAVKNQVDRIRPDLELDFDAMTDWPHILSNFTGRILTHEAATFPDATLVRF